MTDAQTPIDTRVAPKIVLSAGAGSIRQSCNCNTNVHATK